MGNIQEGLKAIIEDRKEIKGLTQKGLARKMGAKPAMVSALLNGKRRLNEDWIEKFCSALNITLGDLEAATRKDPEPRVLREYSEKLKRLYEVSPVPGFRAASRTIDEWLAAMEPARAKPYLTVDADFSKPGQVDESEIQYMDSDQPQPVMITRIPHYDAIPAGDPREMNPDGQMWIDIVHSSVKDSCYTLRVMGDSMSPDFLDGDIVMMDYAREPRNGDIVAALIDD